jgi:hypothetical protein
LSTLVHLPNTLVSELDLQADSIAPDLPEVAEVIRHHPTSVAQLDAKNAYIEHVVSKVSIAPGVTYHSIIARKSMEGPVEESNDGLVPYRSAYLPGASSTLVIHSGHRVQLTTEAIREIRRILLIHAAEHPVQAAGQ